MTHGRRYGVGMVDVGELQDRVASQFDRLDLPRWPDPHPQMVSPGDDEYSRITDPERYRIGRARARAWAAVLEDALDVRTETLTPASEAGVDSEGAFDRGVSLIPSRPGTLPLVLLERDVPLRTADATLPVVHVGVLRPDVVLEMQPHCGCDACDSGSSHPMRGPEDVELVN